MSKGNYYDILGVSKTATDKEITKAFRKLSLKYHPDKQTGKTDEEKRDAENKFKEINEAYSTLSDADKRREYDNNDVFGGGDFGGWDFNSMRESAYRRFYGNNFSSGCGANTDGYHESGRDVRMEIPLSLVDVYNGCTKKLKFTRRVRCANCHGKGGVGAQERCSSCGGSGYITNNSFGWMSMRSTCQDCGGVGHTYKSKCPTCHGVGLKEESHTVEVTFPPAMMEGYAVQMNGHGEESTDPKGNNGNFFAIAKYNFDKDRYEVRGLDIIEKVHIPYYDILLGCEHVIEMPNHTKNKINIPSCIPDGQTLRMFHCGIKSADGKYTGDYYVEVHYKMPTEISDAERKHLGSIKVINYEREL